MGEVSQASAPFFRGVTHDPVELAGTLRASCFYDRVAGFDVIMSVASGWARQVTAGTALQPLRVAPGRSVLTISAVRYEHSDVGPYNELLIGLPVTLARRGGPVTLLRWLRHGGGLYVWRVAVTTEIARDLGARILGWPKSMAAISVDVERSPVSCSVTIDDEIVLSVSARRPHCRITDERQRFDMYARDGDRILRCQAIDHILQSGARVGGDIHVRLGNHPIARELHRAAIGRALGLSVVTRHEMVLTGVLESWQMQV